MLIFSLDRTGKTTRCSLEGAWLGQGGYGDGRGNTQSFEKAAGRPTEADPAQFLIDMPAAFGLHKSMWTTTIRNQGTEEQHKMFLQPSLDFDIIGSVLIVCHR